ncbi:MAG: glutamine amidotransferase [Candidatus Riflebacteria bacterium]|nr:glutamine amidotransferase [Candidatus Riflebacteria bacterium]
MNKIAVLYVFDTMADWEPAFLMPELNTQRFFREGAVRFQVKTVGVKTGPIKTMGGLRILPDFVFEDLNLDEVGLFVLPGGDTWSEPFHSPAFEMAQNCLSAKITVGGICGATLGLAANGFLDTREHTSNDLSLLKMMCPKYQGEKYYRNQPSVIDGNLVTASGLASLEFARDILKRIDVFAEATLDAWYNLHLTREARYYFSLMESLPKR